MTTGLIVEIAVRFIIGGLVVTAFAVIGDVLRPKSFAGIFGAAPSVALATLGLTFALKGGTYASVEGLSMIFGAVAFFLYVLPLRAFLIRRKLNALVLAIASWAVWLAAAFGLWALFAR
ncbi:MAG TPA: DUF3147 family protein [Chloroflexota bacterium]|nr:DUF3147 family protein [Chloroflexota bacterium]